MLGLWPLPERGDLRAVVTGKLAHPEFTVEKLHFQSLPGLYVTANLYLPRQLEKPAPAILYFCGHASVVTNKLSCGNKTAYQHHAVWFARNGYVCLVLDTVQLGELQGLHHGTYREQMWWWNSRGYTPAGVEAWNGVRALDYLQSRPEVDRERLGVTGRSGGGAYSWWLAAIDERVKVAAPVAGITDLQNHVVDGAVEGHCDCMFIVNTYRWDYPQVAALVAPRPLLIANSDKDSIFPLDGVVRLHAKVRRVYELYGATTNLGLLITEGPHKDTQDLQLPVFRWFNRHLRKQDPIIEMAATRAFTPLELRVFDQLPSDERTTRIHDTFTSVARAAPAIQSATEWRQARDAWLAALREKTFAAWPLDNQPANAQRASSMKRHGLRFEIWDLLSQPGMPLRFYVAQPDRGKAKQGVLYVLDEKTWPRFMALFGEPFVDLLTEETNLPGHKPGSASSLSLAAWRDRLLAEHGVAVFFAPRGVGLTAWNPEERKQAQIRRRFMLLGQTLDGGRVWDIRRAIRALRSGPLPSRLPLVVQARGIMAMNALYAAVFEPGVNGLELANLPATHKVGPDYLNVLRVLDAPQTLALASERVKVNLFEADAAAWEFPLAVIRKLGWAEDRLVVKAGAGPDRLP
jgi:dienelactone hydrolase